MIVKVLIDTPVKKLNKVYDYLVPKEFEDKIDIGKRVLINFGRGKGNNIFGIIVKVINEDTNTLKLKYIIDVVDSKSYINLERLKLAKWIARMYFCNVYQAIKLFLPSMTPTSIKNKDLKGKQANILCLRCDSMQIEEDLQKDKIKSGNHIKLLRCIIENGFIYESDAITNLGISKSVIKTVEKNGYIEIKKVDIENEDYSNVERTNKLIPTEEQKSVIDGITEKIVNNKFSVSLLYGITGSGKTEVYLQIIEECMKAGKTAIVLVPEISLTYQTKLRFISRFGDIVSVLHSKMTILERETEYKRIIDGKAKIVIGPRSALFVPLDNIGLVVIDEEHDSSYISGQTPRYSTKEVATKICYENKAALLLGTATPEISTMYKAKTGKIELYKMTKRPSTYTMPKVEIIDMKEEIVSGNNSNISSKLKEEINKNLENKEQTFIFLNRRGHSTYLMCNECGHMLKCPKCDVTLTYHRKANLMLCHYCSHAEKVTGKCPVCYSENMVSMGTGTEKIEEQIKKIFPTARVVRMDMDSTIKKGSQENILNEIKDGKADILVGTQMISKGHDIPNVTLVGIINADSTFARDDVLSSEKAFANLLQVSGRAGRGEKQGRVIVQAYDTENYIIDSIKKQSYEDFYNKEIEYRKLLCFPPFTDILLIELTSENKQSVTKDSIILYEILSSNNNSLYNVYTPKAPFVSKINNKYKIQIILKAKIDDKVLNTLYENLEKYDKICSRNVGIVIAKNPTYIN